MFKIELEKTSFMKEEQTIEDQQTKRQAWKHTWQRRKKWECSKA